MRDSRSVEKNESASTTSNSKNGDTRAGSVAATAACNPRCEVLKYIAVSRASTATTFALGTTFLR